MAQQFKEEKQGVLSFNAEVEKVVKSDAFGTIGLVFKGINFPSYKKDVRINETNVARLNAYTLVEAAKESKYIRRAETYAEAKCNKIPYGIFAETLRGAKIEFTRTFHEAGEERQTLKEDGTPETFENPTWTTEIKKIEFNYQDVEFLAELLQEFKEDMREERKNSAKQTIVINPAVL